MADVMTKWGVGPRFTLYSIIYGLLILGLLASLGRVLRITSTIGVSYQVLELIGIVLVVLGIPFYLSSIVTVIRAFKEGRLVTSGSYGMCRHPVYAAFIVFFVPAVALFTDSWAALSVPVVMYLIARTLVSKEDVYLEEAFGQEYLSYRKRVPAFMPYGWLKR